MQTEVHLVRQANYLRFWSALFLGLISISCLVTLRTICPLRSCHMSVGLILGLISLESSVTILKCCLSVGSV